jgi:hypothetical protein
MIDENNNWPTEVDPQEEQKSVRGILFVFVGCFVFWGVFWLIINHGLSKSVG